MYSKYMTGRVKTERISVWPDWSFIYRWKALEKSFPMVYNTWQSEKIKLLKSPDMYKTGFGFLFIF